MSVAHKNLARHVEKLKKSIDNKIFDLLIDLDDENSQEYQFKDLNIILKYYLITKILINKRCNELLKITDKTLQQDVTFGKSKENLIYITDVLVKNRCEPPKGINSYIICNNNFNNKDIIKKYSLNLKPLIECIHNKNLNSKYKLELYDNKINCFNKLNICNKISISYNNNINKSNFSLFDNDNNINNFINDININNNNIKEGKLYKYNDNINNYNYINNNNKDNNNNNINNINKDNYDVENSIDSDEKEDDNININDDKNAPPIMNINDMNNIAFNKIDEYNKKYINEREEIKMYNNINPENMSEKEQLKLAIELSKKEYLNKMIEDSPKLEIDPLTGSITLTHKQRDRMRYYQNNNKK